MNFYPYYNGMQYMPIVANTKTSFLKGLFKNINFSSILNGTQKTLGLVNQAIPLIKQAGPVINNAKTMFKVMNEFKKNDIISPINNQETIEGKTNLEIKKNDKMIEQTVYKNNGPVFFQ